MPFQTSITIAGLVDAHVHVRERAGFADAAVAGISALRDAGFRENAAAGILAPAKDAGGPTVVSGGWALYSRGGYGSLFGVGVSTRDEMRAEIIRLKRSGAGIIKIIASGMVSLKQLGRITRGGFDADTLAFMVDAAMAQDLGVMAHVNGEAAIMAAVQAGVRSVEHGFFMTERVLERMAKKGVFWVPTIAALSRAAGSPGTGVEVRQFVDGLVTAHMSRLRYAHAIGVPLAIGTDFLLPHAGYRAAYDAELAYFEKAGIPRDQVRTIACEGGARLLGIRLRGQVASSK
jgi:imidazolonepropionase-like amidohydrolase